MNFKVGDEVRDYINGGTKDRINNEKVVSVGRKYIHATRHENEKFTSKFEST